MDDRFIDLLIVMVAPVGITVVLIGAASFSIAARIRRQAWIAVCPELRRPAAEDLSPAVGALLAAAAKPLSEAGFAPAESAHAPRFSAHASWTQVLFLNRRTGERASVIGLHEAGIGYANLVLATEFAGGETVTTSLCDEWAAVAPQADVAACLPAVDVAGLCDRHRTEVTRVRSERPAVEGRAEPVLPPPGGEFEWLQQRASRVAEDIAGSLGYRRDRTPAAIGAVYRLSWPIALRAAPKYPLGRAMQTVAPRPRGFGVIPRPQEP